jgi:glycerophosphoryl diester phosphodiesterase
MALRFCCFSVLFMLLLSACTSTAPVTLPQPFDWEGHRGCRGILPENSIPAFLKALDYPEVNVLELDLAVSKDGQLMVSHEPWFNPAICLLPNGDSIKAGEAEKILLYQLTAAEIQQYDCGSKGNARFPEQQKMRTHKPTLRELVTAVRTQRSDKADIRWNIEIKSNPAWDNVRHPAVEVFAQMVIDEVKALGLERHCIIQSFDERPLQYIHQKDPALTIALLVENTRSMAANIESLGFQPAIYSPYFQLVSKRLVRQCKARHLKLVPWTVNNVSDMRALIRLGVDGIITDYPNRIREVAQ